MTPRRYRVLSISLLGCVLFPLLSAAQGGSPLWLSFAPNGEAYALTQKQPSLRFPFRIESAQEAIAGARLDVSPFVDREGKLFEASIRIDSKTEDPKIGFDVPATGWAAAEVDAELPGPGTYVAHLSLIYRGQRHPPVSLTVTRPDPTIDVMDIPAVRAACGRAEVPLSVRESSGQSVRIPLPQLLRLVDVNGQVRLALPRPSYRLVDGRTRLSQPLQLAAGGTRALDLRLAGLPRAGQYEGVVRFSPGGGLPPIDKTFSLYARRSAWWAFLAILLGVAASFLLRWYLGEVKPRLIEERRAQVLLGELDETARLADLAPRELELVQAVRREVANVALALSMASPLDAAKSQLDVLQQKVPLLPDWIRLRRAVAALRPENLQEDLLTDLNGVEATLAKPNATAAEVQSAADKLVALPGRIEAKVRAELDTRLTRLEATVRGELAAAGSKLTDALTALVQPALARARRAWAGGDLPGALQALAEARVAHAVALADDLDRRLSAAPPEQVTAEDWTALHGRVTAALAALRQPPVDADAADAALQTAQVLYLGGLAGLLIRWIDAQLAGTAESDAERQRREALRPVREQLTAVQGSVAQGKLAEAARSLVAAEQALADAAGTAKLERAAPRPAALAVGAPGSASLRATLPGRREATPAQLVSAITRRLDLADWLSNLAVLVIAATLGIVALWVNNLSWGSFADWLTAFLWGLGLHQFTYQGVRGLMTQLTTSS